MCTTSTCRPRVVFLFTLPFFFILARAELVSAAEACTEAYASDSSRHPNEDSWGCDNGFPFASDYSGASVDYAWATANAQVYVTATEVYKYTITDTGFQPGNGPKNAFARAEASGTDFVIEGPANTSVDLVLLVEKSTNENGQFFLDPNWVWVNDQGFPPGFIPGSLRPRFNTLHAAIPPDEAPGAFDVYLDLNGALNVGGQLVTSLQGTATLRNSTIPGGGLQTTGDLIPVFSDAVHPDDDTITFAAVNPPNNEDFVEIRRVGIPVGPNGSSELISLDTNVYMMVGGDDIENVFRDRDRPSAEEPYVPGPGVAGDPQLVRGGGGSFNLVARPANPDYIVIPVPEPSSILLLAMGFLCAAILVRRARTA